MCLRPAQTIMLPQDWIQIYTYQGAACKDIIDFEFQKAYRIEKQDLFVLEGDMYKRSRYPEQPEELRDWLDRKSVCFSCYPGIEELFAENLAERIAEDLQKMKPVYDFLIYAESRI